MEEDDDEEGSGVRVLWVLGQHDGSVGGFAGGGDGGGFFFFAVVCGGEWMWWMWMDVDVDVEVSFCCDFLFSFFVSGGCGMGGGFCGDYW